VTRSDCARWPLRGSDKACSSEPKRTSGRSRSFPSTLVLLRPPIHFRRPGVLSSPRQLRCAAAVIAREAYWVVEHGDNHCSRENGGAEHKGNYKGVGPSRRGRCRPGVGRFPRSTHSPPAAPHRASRLLPWSCWAPSKRGAPLLGSRSRRCNLRSESAIRLGSVLGSSDWAASSRAIAA
jgi:hypothetical protein